MDSITRPIKTLAEKAAWFTRATEIRVLSVAVSGDLRDAALRVLAGQEHHADNRSPFLRFDDAHAKTDDGWAMRTRRAAEQHEARRTAMAKEGHALPALPAVAIRDLSALAEHAVTLRDVADARCPPLSGLVVLLAPSRVDDPVRFGDDVATLVTSPRLSDVRWIVVEPERRSLDALCDGLDEHALRVDCFVDDAAQQKELEALLEGASTAGADSPPAARAGAAWPRGVTAPPRPGRAPADPEARARLAISLGLPAASVDGTAERFARATMQAALLLRRGDGPGAIRAQREARDLCVGAGMTREAILAELVLGSYLVHLNERPLAIEVYESASERASAAEMPAMAAQAQLALGATRLLEGQRPAAAASYARAGELAERAMDPVLAIEAYRMTGQIAFDARLETPGTNAWRRALEVAAVAPPEVVQASSAADVARKLAAVCRAHGLHPQAASLELRAQKLETGQSLDVTELLPPSDLPTSNELPLPEPG